ncbi:DSBA oxidoreductase [Viridothelium virens]|uniref:DSBA oxidoreductase n=1 Tax=Viridothelium virens TaxID=1048519 RepID=A0A6A6H2M2_VIRVR|nr:DSBA oxidoreductase [Viridothelium virens]
MTNFDIKITSDTICPWCYIGYRRLQKGISLFQKTYPGAKKDTFTIHWAPYYLRPDASSISVPFEERLSSRVSADQAQKFKDIMFRTGVGEGISFKFGSRLGNTRDSHRLIAMAGKEGTNIQTRLMEELFKGHFEEEQDITSHEFLVQAGKAAGLGEDFVRTGLNDDKCGREVDEEAQAAARDGVKGVPHFSINTHHKMGGAQDASEWMEVFTAIKEGEGSTQNVEKP